MSFWFIQNPSYEQKTKRGNGKKDSRPGESPEETEQVGMTESMTRYVSPEKRQGYDFRGP